MNGTENPKDPSQAGDTSKGGQGTSAKEPETFTTEQATEMATKATQDALSAAGRTAKALEAREQAVKAAELRSAQAQKDKDEAELEDARDDKERLTVIDARHKARDAKAELTTVKSELEAEREKGKQRDAEKAETSIEIAAFEIATKHTVDAVKLKELSKFTDGSTEAIEAIAQSMVKKGEPTPPLTTVSGKMIGGGASFEQIRDEMIKNPSDDEKMRRYMEAKKIQGK